MLKLGLTYILVPENYLRFLYFSRIIKLSSPKLNYLIGFGAILLYVSIVLLAIPLQEQNRDLATTLCLTTPWFTAVGYSLCYGTILVKMFRTWYIFSNPLAKKKQVWVYTWLECKFYV